MEQAARVIRAFRQAAARQADLPAVSADMTSYLEPFFSAEEFVTALLVDAGQLRPSASAAVRADGRGDLIEAPPGLPLRLPTWLHSDYTEITLTWTPGDRLLLYTDGLSEARNRDGNFLSPMSLAPEVRSATV